MISDIADFIIGSWGTFIFFCCYMAMRNSWVYKERMKVHHKIFEQYKNGGYKRSYNEIVLLLKERDLISTYNEMVWRFWKRPSSFYKEFLEKLG